MLFQVVRALVVSKNVHMHIYMIVFLVINFIVILKFYLHFYDNAEYFYLLLEIMSIFYFAYV